MADKSGVGSATIKRMEVMDGVLHCAPCREKTAAAGQADQEEVARRARTEKPAVPASKKSEPTKSVPAKPEPEEIPF